MIVFNLVPVPEQIIQRGPIDAAIAKGTRQEFMRFGAYVRRVTMNSLKYRAKPSIPGQPPSVHRSDRFTYAKRNRKTGITTRQQASPLRELVRFTVIDGAEGAQVLIGPMGSGSRSGDAPHALETGSGAIVRKAVPRARGRKAGPRQSESFQRLVKEGRIIIPPREIREVEVKIARRPFIGPAFRIGLGRIPQLFAGSVGA